MIIAQDTIFSAFKMPPTAKASSGINKLKNVVTMLAHKNTLLTRWYKTFPHFLSQCKILSTKDDK